MKKMARGWRRHERAPGALLRDLASIERVELARFLGRGGATPVFGGKFFFRGVRLLRRNSISALLQRADQFRGRACLCQRCFFCWIERVGKAARGQFFHDCAASITGTQHQRDISRCERDGTGVRNEASKQKDQDPHEPAAHRGLVSRRCASGATWADYRDADLGATTSANSRRYSGLVLAAASANWRASSNWPVALANTAHSHCRSAASSASGQINDAETASNFCGGSLDQGNPAMP